MLRSSSPEMAKMNRCTPGGIGYAVANEFHGRGYHVIATARRSELLEKFRRQGMDAVALDVTDASSIKACRQEVGKLVDGKLDILINNAYVSRHCYNIYTDSNTQRTWTHHAGYRYRSR
jgi:NADP-dependent 3-hydroxy acid dehydrogenase YdfG